MKASDIRNEILVKEEAIKHLAKESFNDGIENKGKKNETKAVKKEIEKELSIEMNDKLDNE